jgi:hypothetical protein
MPELLKPIQPPSPKWYDKNAKCKYYAGVVGHSINCCQVFRRKIDQLIQHGWLSF